MKRYIKANQEDVTDEIVHLLASLEGTYSNPTTGWSGTVTYDYDGYDNVNNAYIWSIKFNGDSGNSSDTDYLYRYTGKDHRSEFMLMPASGMPIWADSMDELRSAFRREYSYLKKSSR